MKILYGIQATGNGHICRAMEIIPELRKYAKVDILISGTENSISLPFEVKYQKHGLCFYFGKNADIDIKKSLKNLKPIRLKRDINECPVGSYDLVVSDFEPITAWAAKRQGIKSISISHQAAFQSPKTPRPVHKSLFAEKVLRYYAPTDKYIGFHFKPYDENIFQPVIRKEIRALIPEEQNHFVVYLPSYAPMYLVHVLSKIENENWRIFSKHCQKVHKIKNVEIYPTSNAFWLESLRTSKGVLIGAGFEGPSEALFLGKKLMVTPMKGQYEQLCNAVALEEFGVPSIRKLDLKSIDKVMNWISSDNVKRLEFPSNTKEVVDGILSSAI